MLLSVTDFVGVSKTSACRIVLDISFDIANFIANIFSCTLTQNMSFIILLGSHVFLVQLMVHTSEYNHHVGEEFRNRKGYFSLNVQAVCNANLLFMNVVARWPGSAHDATIFNASELRAQCESGLFGNGWLLGDSAYPLKPYLLPPLLNPQT
ncbi:hypothetical protein SFRURICE_001237 [Spodoptera frugiperda]|uniref:SFRICE_026232 n=1 Tax=Spodoptera frugiperda TaxID=7108 RepID=A0A2H1WR24_SPOFR|nr:hypothetical protein SFRURICE_001237 [Spodoptera frugiperda]